MAAINVRPPKIGTFVLLSGAPDEGTVRRCAEVLDAQRLKEPGK